MKWYVIEQTRKILGFIKFKYRVVPEGYIIPPGERIVGPGFNLIENACAEMDRLNDIAQLMES